MFFFSQPLSTFANRSLRWQTNDLRHKPDAFDPNHLTVTPPVFSCDLQQQQQQQIHLSKAFSNKIAKEGKKNQTKRSSHSSKCRPFT